jgi:hypothetical protein
MSAELKRWIEETERRRPGGQQPFELGLVSDRCLDPTAAHWAAVRTVVNFVAGRPVTVVREEGLSYADLSEALVNLDGRVSDPERLYGIAAHEAAHLLLTRMLAKNCGRLFRMLHNVIEDERIECEVARRFPALAHPLAIARRELCTELEPNADVIQTLFALVRAPTHITPANWDAHGKLLLESMEILEPFPSSPGEVEKAVHRIIALLPEHIRKHPPLGRIHVCGRERREDRKGHRARRLADLAAKYGRAGGFDWLDEHGEVGTPPPVVWSEAPSDPQRYESIQREVAQEAAALAARIELLLPTRSRDRLPQGRLDPRRLYAWRTDGRVFRGPDSRTERLGVALIVDLSSSMRGSGGDLARRIAILLSETCALVRGVRLYAYGHNADDGAERTHIRRYSTSATGRAFALGSIDFAGNNRDAHAIEAIGQDLLAREGPKRTPRVAILISDARPNARGFKGNSAVAATRRAVEWLEGVWGPAAIVSTKESPVLHKLVPEPLIPYDPNRPVEALTQLMERCIRRR